MKLVDPRGDNKQRYRTELEHRIARARRESQTK